MSSNDMNDVVSAWKKKNNWPPTSEPDGQKSDENKLDITFLEIFQLVGTISPEKIAISTILYANIPNAGRVELAEIQGPLAEGPIKVAVNLVLAKGGVIVSAKENTSGKHDLYINLDLDIKNVKTFNTGDIKLSELPF